MREEHKKEPLGSWNGFICDIIVLLLFAKKQQIRSDNKTRPKRSGEQNTEGFLVVSRSTFYEPTVVAFPPFVPNKKLSLMYKFEVKIVVSLS